MRKLLVAALYASAAGLVVAGAALVAFPAGLIVGGAGLAVVTFVVFAD